MQTKIHVDIFDRVNHGLELSDDVHIATDGEHIGIYLPIGFEVDFSIEDLRKLLAKIDEGVGA